MEHMTRPRAALQETFDGPTPQPHPRALAPFQEQRAAIFAQQRVPREIRMIDEIRAVLRQHARLAADVDTLAPEADLYAAGLTSHATVNLMVALEDHFGVEFPERMLRRRSFESIAAIAASITELQTP
ncbi:MAG: hypothetical protein RL385_3729 [Pseudomonadota bacterium]|jgi:acyl carrier protein